MAENDDLDDMELEVEVPERTRPLTPEKCIVEAAIALTLDDGTRMALLRKEVMTAVFTVPNGSWVNGIRRALKPMLGPEWTIIAREEKLARFEKDHLKGAEVAECLAKGISVASIAPAGVITEDMIRAADVTVTIRGADADVVADAICRYTDGPAVDPANSIDATALTLHQLCIAFRPTSDAVQIIGRIERMLVDQAPSFDPDVPFLHDAVEFGDFRTFGLKVIAQYGDFRAGRCEWHQLEASSAILFGAPGLGKTTAVASFAKSIGAAALITTSIADLFSGSGYLDGCIKESRAIFARGEALVAAGKIPICILVDELDALPSRIGLDSRSLSWWGSLISEWLLLCQKSRENIFLFGCTNHIDRIDPALRRPGRFSRSIEMKPADASGLISITRRHLRGALADADLTMFGTVVAGRSAADIMQIVRTAISASRSADRPVEVEDLLRAAVPPSDLSPSEKRWVAVHEAGHIVASLASGGSRVICAAICDGSKGIGHTTFEPTTQVFTRRSIETSIIVMLGGRAAEVVEFGTGSANARSDLESATEMMASLLLSDGLGGSLVHHGSPESISQLLRIDAGIRTLVDRELHALLDRAVGVVNHHKSAVCAIADELEKRQFISGDHARQLFAASRPNRMEETT